MKYLIILATLALAACGGGGSPPAPAPAPHVDLTPIDGNIVWFGDDLTWRWCQPQYTLPWQTVLQDTPIKGQCAAVQGDTSAKMLARVQSVVALRPDFVIIEAGFNDIRNGQSPDLNALIQMVQAFQVNGTHVVLATLPPSADFIPGIQAWNAQVATVAASYGAIIADYWRVIENPASVPEAVKFDSAIFTTPLMNADFPTPNGYELMWDMACSIGGIGGAGS